MTRSRDFRDYLLENLKDPKEAVAYLNAALEDDDRRVFLLALRDVADAWGGMKKLSTKTKLNREGLYRTLSEKGNPELASLTAMLESMGLRLAVEVREPAKKESGHKPPRKKETRRTAKLPASAG
jgi:probable addiction module antidote protein